MKPLIPSCWLACPLPGYRGPGGDPARACTARYLEEVASAYHTWYGKARVTPRADEEVTDLHRTRLWINDAARQVLANGLDLLGVSAPEKSGFRRPLISQPITSAHTGPSARKDREKSCPPASKMAAPEPDGSVSGLWPSTVRRVDGEIHIGGIGVTSLVREYGSPLFVIDEQDMRERARAWKSAMDEAFEDLGGAEVFYAGKAFLSVGVARWMAEEGLAIDTCSEWVSCSPHWQPGSRARSWDCMATTNRAVRLS